MSTCVARNTRFVVCTKLPTFNTPLLVEDNINAIRMQMDLTEQLLKFIEDHGKVDTLDLVPIFNVDHQKIVGALKSIQATGDLVAAEQAQRKTWELSDEGKSVLENGSHEACVFNAVPKEGISQPDLLKVSHMHAGQRDENA